MSTVYRSEATVAGKITDIEGSHTLRGETFIDAIISVKRLNEKHDEIRITVSERLTGSREVIQKGNLVHIKGDVRSFKRKGEDDRSHNYVTVFAAEVREAKEGEESLNEVNIAGVVHKEPWYKEINSNKKEKRYGGDKRKLTEFVVSLVRGVYYSGKKKYLVPCLCWGRDADFARTFKKGDVVKLSGRLQSRTFTKVEGEGEDRKEISRTINEVSCYDVELLGHEYDNCDTYSESGATTIGFMVKKEGGQEVE